MRPSPMLPHRYRRLLGSFILAASIGNAAADFVNFESPQVHPIDLSPDGSTLAVANTADGRVELFDLASGLPESIGSVGVGMDPVSVRFASDASLWVVNHLSDSVSVVDVGSRTVVHTLLTDDEPADVVFADGDPRVAYVSCSQANSVLTFFLDDLSRAPAPLTLAIEEPRSLAIGNSGTLFVTSFESGNGTTVLAGGGDGDVISFPPNAVSDPDGPYGGTNPPPNSGAAFVPALRAGNPVAPPVGLIVKEDADGNWFDDNGGNWTRWVSGDLAPRSGRLPGWGLRDHDVAIVGSAGTTYAGGLMNLGMAIALHPSSGFVSVVGTEATNEVRFEPNLNGRFLRVVVATFDPASPADTTTITDLNPHLDYSVATLPPSLRDQSLGDPRGIAWNAAGTRAYVTGMGSNNLVVIDPSGSRAGLAPTIGVGEGPTGLVVDDARGQLYVLNRFGASVSVVDTATEQETLRVPFFDPTPAEIKVGRRHLYDTHQTSGLGHVSCASCHVDARTDRLAWDLGDPAGEVVALTGATQNLGANVPGLNTDFTDFHPMKGPMTTQTLQDIIGKEPHHWRGDRSGIEAFNGAFTSLLGDDFQLTPAEMQEFEDYLASITLPPNPFRHLDNSLPTDLPLPDHVTGSRFGPAGQPMPNGNALRAFTDTYRPLGRGIDRGTFACVTCHTIPTGMSPDSQLTIIGFGNFVFTPVPPGPMGERHHALVSVDGSTQRAFKVAQLRTLYDKVGFDLTSSQSPSGFGLLHDGSVDGISRFLSEDAFDVSSNQELADLVALMVSFSGSDFPGTPEMLEPPGTASLDAHAAVGQQETIVAPATSARVDTFFALADSGAVDLIAHSPLEGNPRGWLYLGADRFAADEAAVTVSTDDLLGAAGAAMPLTLTCVVAGTGQRLALDRDRDGLRNFDEERDFAPAITGHQNPFQSNAPDTTGDDGSIGPDGIPDGENDFDGDGVSNAAELAAGTNHADNLSVEVPLRVRAALSTDGARVTLEWEAAPLGRYQVQYADHLGNWTDSPTGLREAPVAGGAMSWTDDGPPHTTSSPADAALRFYRIVWY